MTDRADVGKKKKRRSIFPYVGLLIGLLILASPIAFDMYASIQAQRVISTLADESDDLSDPARLEFLAHAKAYNSRLVGEPYDVPSNPSVLPYAVPEDGVLTYDDQLSWKGKPYMAYIHVPKAHIKLPIYHGTADEELAAGSGHLQGRSLPIGGTSVTCVLEGHSGMATSRMFDDIRLLDAGDDICLWTLAEPYAYRVDSWEICDPEEVPSKVDIISGLDRIVLVTCTTTPDAFNPRGAIGINDKRLVVYASRCEYDPSRFEDAGVVAESLTSPRAFPFLIAAVCVIGVIVLLAVSRYVRKRKQKAKCAVEAELEND